MPKELKTVDGATLMAARLPPIRYMIEGLLPQGLHLLAGAPNHGWRSGCVCAWRRERPCGDSPPDKAMCCISAWRTAIPGFRTGCWISRTTHRRICISPPCLKSSGRGWSSKSSIFFRSILPLASWSSTRFSACGMFPARQTPMRETTATSAF